MYKLNIEYSISCRIQNQSNKAVRFINLLDNASIRPTISIALAPIDKYFHNLCENLPIIYLLLCSTVVDNS